MDIYKEYNKVIKKYEKLSRWVLKQETLLNKCVETMSDMIETFDYPEEKELEVRKLIETIQEPRLNDEHENK